MVGFLRAILRASRRQHDEVGPQLLENWMFLVTWHVFPHLAFLSTFGWTKDVQAKTRLSKEHINYQSTRFPNKISATSRLQALPSQLFHQDQAPRPLCAWWGWWTEKMRKEENLLRSVKDNLRNQDNQGPKLWLLRLLRPEFLNLSRSKWAGIGGEQTYAANPFEHTWNTADLCCPMRKSIHMAHMILHADWAKFQRVFTSSMAHWR